jgi:hypothetical protein
MGGVSIANFGYQGREHGGVRPPPDRKTAMIHHILLGMLLLPIGGLGAFWLLSVLRILTMILGVNRGRLFYGSNPAEVRRLQQQQAVRI